MRLSDILECDVDHLLGRMRERTHDNKTACELTGLSENAINKITNSELNHPTARTLSRMIESSRFENLITTYRVFLEFLSKLKASDLDDRRPWFELNDKNVILGTNEAINHFKQEVSLAMIHICEDNYFQSVSQIQDWPDEMELSIEPGRVRMHRKE